MLGTPFYLMSHAAGHVFVQPGLEDLPTPAHRAAVYAEMAATLGALPTASIPPRSVSPDSAARMSTPGASSARWARQYRDCVSVPEPPVVALIDWLRANVPPSEPSGALVHGDFRLDNLVFGSPLGPRGAPDDSGGGRRRPRLGTLHVGRALLGRRVQLHAYHLRRWIPTDPRADARRRTRRSPRVVFPRGSLGAGTTCAPGRRRPDCPTRRRRVRMESSVGRFTPRYRCFEERPSWRGCARARRRGTRPRPTRRRREHWWRRWRIERSSSQGLCPGGVPRGIGSAGTAPRTPPLETTPAVGFEPSPRAAAPGHAASVHVRARLPRRGGARGARGVAGSLVCVRGG